ncbi:MAG: DUF721 domain-containing protein [Rhodomicrobium sp.]
MAISLLEGNNAVPAQAPRTPAGPVAVGRFIAPIAGKTLSRGGVAMAGLISQWPAISGPSLAAYTMPAKLTRTAPEPDFPEKTPASMLHLKVDPARVLEVQYAIPQLVERINRTLGYKAVAGIRLVQAPVFSGRRPASPKPVAMKPAPEAPQQAGKLGSALARMAAGVKARQANCQ